MKYKLIESILNKKRQSIVDKIQAEIDYLVNIWDRLKKEDYCVAIRLQVMPNGSWFIHTGDPSYDPDHRGYWWDTTIDNTSDSDKIADELIEGVIDDCAQH